MKQEQERIQKAKEQERIKQEQERIQKAKEQERMKQEQERIQKELRAYKTNLPKGWKPIHVAAQKGNLPVVKWLVKQDNANVEAENAFNLLHLRYEYYEGAWRPLHLAAQAGHLPVVKWLVEVANANVESKTYLYAKKFTALQIAQRQRHTDVVKYLQSHR